jgi:aconitate hydratase
MGVLPLMFKEGSSWENLGLDGSETFMISGIDTIKARKPLQVKAFRPDGTVTGFEVVARLDTEIEAEYYTNGGILPYVLRKILREKQS